MRLLRACKSHRPATDSVVLNSTQHFKSEVGSRKDYSPDSVFVKLEGGGAMYCSSTEKMTIFSFSMFDSNHPDVDIERVKEEFGELVYTVNFDKLVRAVALKVEEIIPFSVNKVQFASSYVRYADDTLITATLSEREDRLSISLENASLENIGIDMCFTKPEKDKWQGEYRLIVEVFSEDFDEERITLENSDKYDLNSVFELYTE